MRNLPRKILVILYNSIKTRLNPEWDVKQSLTIMNVHGGQVATIKCNMTSVGGGQKQPWVGVEVQYRSCDIFLKWMFSKYWEQVQKAWLSRQIWYT